MIQYQEINSSIPYNYDARTYINYSWISHVHKDYELVYIKEGTIKVTLENHEELYSAGEAILIFPNQIHSFDTCGESLIWIAVFSKDYVPEFHKVLKNRICLDNRIYLEDYDRDILLHKLVEISTNLLEKCAILTFVCAAFMKTRTENDFIIYNYTRSKEMFCQILHYIEQHFRENLTLQTMAKDLGYSKYYLSRYFNSFFNKNFKRFVNEYRISYAKQLIFQSENKLSMTEIAYKSGFQSVRNFNRVYRDITNLPVSTSKVDVV